MAALCQWALDAIILAQMVAAVQVAEGALAAEAVVLVEAEPAVVGKFACFKRNFHYHLQILNFHSPLRIDY